MVKENHTSELTKNVLLMRKYNNALLLIGDMIGIIMKKEEEGGITAEEKNWLREVKELITTD
jgi:hypothetical protein